MSKKKELILRKLAGIYKGHLKLLEFLIQKDKDVELYWEIYFLAKSKDLVSDIYDFRVIQRTIKSIGEDEFIKLYRKDKKAALEKLFQEPLTNDDVDLFVQAGKPLGEVYKLSVEHPSLQLHILLKFWDFVKDGCKVSSFVDSLDD